MQKAAETAPRQTAAGQAVNSLVAGHIAAVLEDMAAAEEGIAEIAADSFPAGVQGAKDPDPEAEAGSLVVGRMRAELRWVAEARSRTAWTSLIRVTLLEDGTDRVS